jgi:dihydroorotate dehydrogenase
LRSVYRLARPLLFALPPEAAHALAVAALANRLVRARRAPDDTVLATRLWGLSFPNPIGLAAGFDKDARATEGALALGFGFVEAGSVTPRPQPGNPRPRLFRLTEDEAVINRLGFNSQGLDAFARRMRARERRAGIVGANVGRNRYETDEAAAYETGIEALAPFADYLVVNVSSPNTPGLRALQRGEALSALASRLAAARDRTGAHGRPPLLVKVAPDLDEDERREVARVARAGAIDGLIVGNTTVARPATLRSRNRSEAGGLSGRPLFGPSTEILADFYRLTDGQVPLVGCGGIATGADAYAKIRAGASLVQLYTALVFHGPGLVRDIARDLAVLLRGDGFTSVAVAVGADHRR